MVDFPDSFAVVPRAFAPWNLEYPGMKALAGKQQDVICFFGNEMPWVCIYNMLKYLKEKRIWFTTIYNQYLKLPLILMRSVWRHKLTKFKWNLKVYETWLDLRHLEKSWMYHLHLVTGTRADTLIPKPIGYGIILDWTHPTRISRSIYSLGIHWPLVNGVQV